MAAKRKKLTFRGWATLVLLAGLILALILHLTSRGTSFPEFTLLEEGLEWGEFPADGFPPDGDSRIRVLRADPAYFAPILYCASETGGVGSARSLRQWARDPSDTKFALVITEVVYDTLSSRLYLEQTVSDLPFSQWDMQAAMISLMDL